MLQLTQLTPMLLSSLSLVDADMVSLPSSCLVPALSLSFFTRSCAYDAALYGGTSGQTLLFDTCAAYEPPPPPPPAFQQPASWSMPAPPVPLSSV